MTRHKNHIAGVTYYLRAGALINLVGLVETDEVSEESWSTPLSDS